MKFLIIFFIFISHQLSQAAGLSVGDPTPKRRVLTPEEKVLVKNAEIRIAQTFELLEALSDLTATAEAAGITNDNYPIVIPRQEESEEEEDEDPLSSFNTKINRVDDIVKKILADEEKRGKNDTNFKPPKFTSSEEIIPGVYLEDLSENELLDLEERLARIVKNRKGGGTTTGNSNSTISTGKNNSTSVNNKGSGGVNPTRVGSVLNSLRNISQYVNRRNILRVLKGTRTYVEFLEDIGLVDELSTPVFIGDGLLTGLESLVG